MKTESLRHKEEYCQQLSLGKEDSGQSMGDHDDEEEDKNSFLTGLVGSAVLFEEDQLAAFLHSKPPAYTHVNMNRYNPQNRPK